MDTNTIIMIIALIVEWALGFVANKSKYISDNLIPIQNALIGLIFTIVEYFITKDFNASLLLSSSIAGGVYDIFHNLGKLAKGE